MTYHTEGLIFSSFEQCSGKLTWPELVGKTGREAKEVIEEENPNVHGVYASQDAIATDDYYCNRVRIILDCKIGGDYDKAKITLVPKVG